MTASGTELLRNVSWSRSKSMSPRSSISFISSRCLMTLLMLSEAIVIPLMQLSSVNYEISMTIVLYCQGLEAHTDVICVCRDEAEEALLH